MKIEEPKVRKGTKAWKSRTHRDRSKYTRVTRWYCSSCDEYVWHSCGKNCLLRAETTEVICDPGLDKDTEA